MKAKIKEGARVSQDMGAYKWKNNNIVFDVLKILKTIKLLTGENKMDDNAKSAEVEKQGQVTEWMELLDSSIKNSDEICQHLNKILQPLLRESPPTENKNTSEVKEQIVPLANQIRDCVSQIDTIADQYQRIIQLLEL